MIILLLSTTNVVFPAKLLMDAGTHLIMVDEILLLSEFRTSTDHMLDSFTPIPTNPA